MEPSFNTSTRSFTRFPDLPPELQIQIWEAALPNRPSVHHVDLDMQVSSRTMSQTGSPGPNWLWTAITWLEPKRAQIPVVYKTLRETCVTANQVVARYRLGKGVLVPIDTDLERKTELLESLKNANAVENTNAAENIILPTTESAKVHVDDLLIFQRYKHMWPFGPHIQCKRVFMPEKGIRHLGVQYDSVADFNRWPLDGHVAYVADVPPTVEAFFFILPPEVFEDSGVDENEDSEEMEWHQESAESLELKVFRDPRKMAARKNTPDEFWLGTRRFYAVPTGHVEERAPSLIRQLIWALYLAEQEMTTEQSASEVAGPSNHSKPRISKDLSQISWGFMTWED